MSPLCCCSDCPTEMSCIDEGCQKQRRRNFQVATADALRSMEVKAERKGETKTVELPHLLNLYGPDRGHPRPPRCPVCRQRMFFSSRPDELICDRHGSITGIMWSVLRELGPVDALIRLRAWQANEELRGMAAAARLDIGVLLGGERLPSLNYEESFHDMTRRALTYRNIFAQQRFSIYPKPFLT